MIKLIAHKVLAQFGYEVRRRANTVPENLHYNKAMKIGLSRFLQLNLPIQTVIDVGAAEGKWSLSARQFWPDASFLLFEPLKERQEQLNNLAKLHSNFTIAPYAAGNARSQLKFSVSEDLDGSGVASGDGNSVVRMVEVTSIQEEVNNLNLRGPFLVKLDTHGYEVPIIEGCSNILSEISLFIVECYGFQIASQSLLFWQMCQYMESLGFRLFDIVDVMNRKKDGAFWQCDAFFIRSDHPVFQDNKYL